MTASGGVSVVGGGVAGLVLAHDLARAGIPVTVLEASGRLGGQIERVELAGRRLDVGAESFATRGGAVAQLAADLGLTAAIRTRTRTRHGSTGPTAPPARCPRRPC